MTKKSELDSKVILDAAEKEAQRWLGAFRLDGKYDITRMMRHMTRPNVVSMCVNGPTELPYGLLFSLYWLDLFTADKFFTSARFQETFQTMSSQRRMSNLFLNTIEDETGAGAGKVADVKDFPTIRKVWDELSGQFVIQLLIHYIDVQYPSRPRNIEQFEKFLRADAEPAQCRIAVSDETLAKVWAHCKKTYSKRYTELTPWDCIWDYYCFAFYESAFKAIEDKPPFLQHSYFDAYCAGLGFIVNHGSLMLGMPLPRVMRDSAAVDARNRNRLHCETGPAIEFGDGTKSWWWRGVQVSQQLIEQPDTIKPADVVKMGNQEQRRAHIERLGYERIATALNLKVIAKDDYGELLESSPNALADDGARPARFVRVTCPSTGRVYVNRVDPASASCLAGLAQRFGIPVGEYIKLTES